jgi:hypothetical protein
MASRHAVYVILYANLYYTYIRTVPRRIKLLLFIYLLNRGYLITLPKVLGSNQQVLANFNKFNVRDDGTVTLRFVDADGNTSIWEQKYKVKGSGKLTIILE